MWQDVGYGAFSEQALENGLSSPAGPRPSSALLHHARLRKWQENLRPSVGTSTKPKKDAASHRAEFSHHHHHHAYVAATAQDPSAAADEVFRTLAQASPSKKRLTLSQAEAFWTRFVSENLIVDSTCVSEHMFGLAMKGALVLLQRQLEDAVATASALRAKCTEPPPLDLALQHEMDLFADYCDEIEHDPDVPAEEKKQAAEKWSQLLGRLTENEKQSNRHVEQLKSNARDAEAQVERIRLQIAEHVALRTRRRPRAPALSSLPAAETIGTFQRVLDMITFSDRELLSRARSEERVLELQRRGELPWENDGHEIFRTDEVSKTQAVCLAAMEETELSSTEFERMYLLILSRF